MIRYIWIVIFVIILIVILSIFNFFLSIHPPKMGEKTNPSEFGLEYEEVEFITKDELTLSGWFIPSNNKEVIIVGHGYPFSKDNVLSLATFLHKDYNLLFFDFRLLTQILKPLLQNPHTQIWMQ